MIDTLEATATPVPGALTIRPRRLADLRGWFSETYSRAKLLSVGIDHDFVQDNLSFNENALTLRGLHFQREPYAQAKLVSVLAGSVLDVIVDLRRSSPFYGRHYTLELDARDGRQLYIPIGVAHGFLTREPRTLFSYKTSKPYSSEHEGGFRFDDPAFGIDWGVPLDAVVISEKDRAWPKFDPLAEQFR
jgi:dTDP-4-dehydrorhamnose 3,5-epimerase